jgi:hypothetical protein
MLFLVCKLKQICEKYFIGITVRNVFFLSSPTSLELFCVKPGVEQRPRACVNSPHPETLQSAPLPRMADSLEHIEMP